MFTFPLVMSVPRMVIFPPVVTSSPFKHRRKVLFPLPEGPMTTTTSLGRISTLTSFKTSRVPNDLFKCSTFINLQPPFQVTGKTGQCENNNKIQKGYFSINLKASKVFSDDNLTSVQKFDNCNRSQQ